MKRNYLRNRLCVPVKGYNRSLIIDLVRNNYFLIPNFLLDVVKTDGIINFNEADDIEKIKQWIEFFLEEEIIFEIENVIDIHLFPEVSYEYHSSALLTSVIIHENLDLKVFQLFDNLWLKNFSIIFSKFELETINRHLKLISKLEIDSITIYISENDPNLCLSDLNKIKLPRQPLSIYLFGCREYKKEKIQQNFLETDLYLFTDSFYSYVSTMYPQKLAINNEHFFEAYNHHNYFNQKLYIDKEGKIKNGLNNKENFGNINSITKNDFLEIIESKNFKRLWNIKKEDTLVCKDCEFRFMCVDPRVPKQNENGEWFHDRECNFNPYISKWFNEEGFKSLQESGVVLSEDGRISIDREKLKKVFESAWN